MYIYTLLKYCTIWYIVYMVYYFEIYDLCLLFSRLFLKNTDLFFIGVKQSHLAEIVHPKSELEHQPTCQGLRGTEDKNTMSSRQSLPTPKTHRDKK